MFYKLIIGIHKPGLKFTGNKKRGIIIPLFFIILLPVLTQVIKGLTKVLFF
jgi:hypothetical protein